MRNSSPCGSSSAVQCTFIVAPFAVLNVACPKAHTSPVRAARTSGWDEIGVMDWERHLSHFLTQLAATTFQGLALDYDGTVVDTARRSCP